MRLTSWRVRCTVTAPSAGSGSSSIRIAGGTSGRMPAMRRLLVTGGSGGREWAMRATPGKPANRSAASAACSPATMMTAGSAS